MGLQRRRDVEVVWNAAKVGTLRLVGEGWTDSKPSFGIPPLPNV